MTKDLIYEDERGNRLMKDIDNRLIVINKQDRLVNPDEARRFLSRDSVRIAMKRYFGNIPEIKVLNSNQTKRIKKKIIGGTY